jgi:thymidylate synthase ThyX
MPYSARIESDSINEYGDRLTTFVVTYPRFIHSEMMTHRMFSRNSSSSRAIPTAKLIAQIESDPVYPIWWGKNQPGMQADQEIADMASARRIWEGARDAAVAHARQLDALGMHKQLVNRVLEPYSWITVIISATDYSNFFKLRCNSEAQPEMQWIAGMMRDAYYGATPILITDGWHLPFVREAEKENLETALHLSVARCARVSLLTHDGKHDPSKDLNLAKRLQESGHWSPFEHQATPTLRDYAGNFTGWKQNRHRYN